MYSAAGVRPGLYGRCFWQGGNEGHWYPFKDEDPDVPVEGRSAGSVALYWFVLWASFVQHWVGGDGDWLKRMEVIPLEVGRPSLIFGCREI